MNRFSLSRPVVPPLRVAGLTALLSALAVALSGCGGVSAGTGTYITGITVSPSSIVAPGTEVTVTAAVKDATKLTFATWTADGGVLSVDKGLVAKWIAPSGTTAQAYTLKVTAQQTGGLTETAPVRILVDPTASSQSGARITSITSSAPQISAGGVITATATVADVTTTVLSQWTADIGSLISDRGLSVQWRAPATVTSDTIATLTLSTRGADGGSYSAQLKILVTLNGTSSHLISAVDVSPAVVTSGGISKLTVTPVTGVSIASIQWSAPDGTLSSLEGLSVQWVSPTVTQSATYNINVTVKDTNGGVEAQTLHVVVQPKPAA